MATTGMEGFVQQVGALSGQAQGLRVAMDNGQLIMDPEAAERVAKVYEDKADRLLLKTGDVEQFIARCVWQLFHWRLYGPKDACQDGRSEVRSNSATAEYGKSPA